MTESAVESSAGVAFGRFQDLILRRDADPRGVYVADAVHEFPFDGRVLRGVEEIAAQFTQGREKSPLHWSKFDNLVVYPMAGGEELVAEYDLLGTIAGTDREVSVRALVVLRAADGLVASVREYFNPAQAKALMEELMGERS